MVICSMYPFPFHAGFGHDPGVALLTDNDIFALEEGKITESVLASFVGFPQRSFAAAFCHSNVTPFDVDHWVFGCPSSLDNKESLFVLFRQLKFSKAQYDDLVAQGRIHFIAHHLAHTALAVYGSGFKDGAYLSIDGGGDEAQPTQAMWGTFDGNAISEGLELQHNTHGITSLYSYLCDAAGFVSPVEVGKLMGLGAYGSVRKELYDALSGLLKPVHDGTLTQYLGSGRTKPSDYRFYKYKCDTYNFFKMYHAPNAPEDLLEITKRYSAPDIAATGQQLLEDVVTENARSIMASTGKDRLVCSGGLFQNILLNTRLHELPEIKEVYVPMAANDAGLALGGALHVMLKTEKVERPSKLLSPYLGPAFSDDDIQSMLDEYDLAYDRCDDIARDVAKLLADGKIVGWFQGRAELGPRALGARSVLADPRNLKNKALINQLLKRRDWFMPYAPSALKESYDQYFVDAFDSPYMAFAFSVHEDKRALIPCAVHIDGTSRPNIVDKEDNPLYYRLIKCFEELTGLPVILNTSFNRHGIATIISPRQAVHHLLNQCFDYLAIGSFLVKKPYSADRILEDNFTSEDIFLLLENIYAVSKAFALGENNPETVESIFNGTVPTGIQFDFEEKTVSIHGTACSLTGQDRKALARVCVPLLEKGCQPSRPA